LNDFEIPFKLSSYNKITNLPLHDFKLHGTKLVILTIKKKKTDYLLL